MKKVAFYTLGCKLNFAETSTIGRLFEQNKFKKVDFKENPDVFVINTCSVTDNADKKCKKIVQEARIISSHAYIIIIGCYAQLKPKEIASIPGVDAVLGSAEKFKIFELFKNFEKQRNTQIHVATIKKNHLFHHAYSINDRTRTFLKIQDGCNYHCSFCTIPLARGKSRSNTIKNIVQQAKQIAEKGIQEIVLTGVNTGDYGIINGKRTTNFFTLLKELAKISIPRIRISSIEPNLLHDEIIHFVASTPSFVPHFHIPLQSGNNKILGLMRRRYTKELYESRIQTILKLMPYCSIGADIIVGFPSETEENFLTTYHFLNALPITYLHVFPYSKRNNTQAIHLSNLVSTQQRTKRAQQLRILSEKKQYNFYQKNIGKKRKVLFEEAESNTNHIKGFTENYIRVIAPYNQAFINSIQKVTLKKINHQGFMEIE